MTDPEVEPSADGEPNGQHTADSPTHEIRVYFAEGARPHKHPASAAQLKLQRAKDHFKDFRSELAAYYNATPWTMTPMRDGPDLALILESHEPVPELLALIAGDLVHNARSALDCAIMELAELGLGTLGRPPESEPEEHSLSFPIGEKALTAGKITSLERFLPAAIVECLRLLQPIENIKRRLVEQEPTEALDELAAQRVHYDTLLRLSKLNNWDKHRRLTFSFLVPQSVSSDGGTGGPKVSNKPGELDDLRGITWLGVPEPETRAVKIDDPAILAQLQAAFEAADAAQSKFDFHFSWWPLRIGDEIGRYIPYPGADPVPDIAVEASLRLVLFEPDMLHRRERMAAPADLLLASIIEDVSDVISLLFEDDLKESVSE